MCGHDLAIRPQSTTPNTARPTYKFRIVELVLGQEVRFVMSFSDRLAITVSKLVAIPQQRIRVERFFIVFERLTHCSVTSTSLQPLHDKIITTNFP